MHNINNNKKNITIADEYEKSVAFVNSRTTTSLRVEKSLNIETNYIKKKKKIQGS